MSPKLRKYLILAHLWLAGLMAPAFALHAISGGLYLMNIKGEAATERVALPVDAKLDFKSETLEADVRTLLTNANIKHDFEYVKIRETLIQLRPTSKPYLEFKQTKLVALFLLAVVFGGILVGLLAKAYRRHTVIAVGVGLISFVLVGFVL